MEGGDRAGKSRESVEESGMKRRRRRRLHTSAALREATGCGMMRRAEKRGSAAWFGSQRRSRGHAAGCVQAGKHANQDELRRENTPGGGLVFR